jgi:hypothetical protein
MAGVRQRCGIPRQVEYDGCLLVCARPQVTLKKHIANCSQGAALVAAILTGEADLLGSALCEWLHLLLPTASPPLLLALFIKCEEEFRCC